MPTPFPGMDPYLEHPALWPDVQNSLTISIAHALAHRIAPRYYAGLGQRSYLIGPEDVILAVRLSHGSLAEASASPDADFAGVKPPKTAELTETFLEIVEVATGRLVTVLQVTSPGNKLNALGRETYEQSRAGVLATRTNLVEIDLLRAGEPLPLPVIGEPVPSDYRILDSRGARRPRAQLYVFGLRTPIPAFPLPLLPGEAEPPVDLNAVLHALYDRARFDLRLDYARPPVPPLDEADAAWAGGRTGA